MIFTVQQSRRYKPAEEYVNHTRYLVLEDPLGTIRTIDLTLEVVTYTAKESDVTYYLYNKYHISDGYAIRTIDEVDKSGFDRSKQTVFICHGWRNNYQSSVNTLITSAALQTYDINVFVVDWSGPANKDYFSAKLAVSDIGYFVGKFINNLMKKYAISVSQFTLVGHSLGAHVVGKAGATVNGLVDHIIGLDPAGPLFTIDDTNDRLDTTDAGYVEIIHTCAELGFDSSIGHSDFYPNGGSAQPGCGVDATGICSHGRSYQFFAESIKNGGTPFTAEKCSNFDDYIDGKCVGNQRAAMGQLYPDKK